MKIGPGKTNLRAARNLVIAVSTALGVLAFAPSLHASSTTPVITSISVATGSAAGGTQVTITGTDFSNVSDVAMGTSTTDPTANNNSISAGNYTVNSDTSITVTVPPRPCAATTIYWYFRVTTSDGGQSAPSPLFTYTKPATVFTSVTPSYGPNDGTYYPITVTGTFRCVAWLKYWNGAQYSTALTPDPAYPNPILNPVTMTELHFYAGYRASSGVWQFQINTDVNTSTTKASIYNTVISTVSTVSPSTGSSNGGTSITISGTNFAAIASTAYIGISSVTIGGNACTNLQIVSATSLTCTTPAGTAGAKNVVLTDNFGQTVTKTNGFTYPTPPTVTSVSPTSGPIAGGTFLTVYGTGFLTGATVKVGGTTCTTTTVGSTYLYCTTGSASPSSADVEVTNTNGGVGTGTGLFTYTAPAPTVTAITPTAGDIAGLQNVTITGTGFLSGATVEIGAATACTGVVVVDANTITCTTSAHTAVVGVTVRVTNTDSQYGELANAYTYESTTTTTTTTTITTTTTTLPPTTTTTTTTSTLPPTNTTSTTSTTSTVPTQVASNTTTSTTSTSTTTTPPASMISADVPKLVAAADVEKLEQTPNGATAVVNGQIVAVKIVEAPVSTNPAELQQAAASIVNELEKLTPAGATNPVKVVNTSDGAELTGLLTNPDNPSEKLNVPVEAVKLLKVGNDSAVLLAAMNQTNLPADLSPSGAIEVTRGGILAARAYGLGASETGEIVLMSTPRLLQNFTVSSTGTFNGQVPLPKNISFGSHTVVMATKNAKVSLGITLVRTKLQFRIKRVIGTTLFKNRAGVKKAGGAVTVKGSGRCKATNTKITMGSKPGACYITVSQAAKGSFKALTYRFTVSVVTKVVKTKKK